MADESTRQVIFQAVNHHGASAGVPPSVSTSIPGQYCGYFENEHREQFIFVYEYESRQATLWTGDNGWETPASVWDADAPSLILNDNEKTWLRACWLAATAFEGRK